MPQISKQIVKDLIATLDAYGCGAHHPDLLPLLEQLEGEPVAYMNPDDLCADTAFRWVKLDEFTEPVFTHPAPFTPITADKKFTQLQAEVEALRKDAVRYQWLRRMSVGLSLSHQVISQFVTNQGELDAVIAKDTQE